MKRKFIFCEEDERETGIELIGGASCNFFLEDQHLENIRKDGFSSSSMFCPSWFFPISMFSFHVKVLCAHFFQLVFEVEFFVSQFRGCVFFLGVTVGIKI
jgi:hypothetical protein